MRTKIPDQAYDRRREIVGANIDRGIKAKGLYGSDLAKILNVGEMEISRWRHGVHLPALKTQVKLARVLFDGDVNELYKPIRNGRKPAA